MNLELYLVLFHTLILLCVSLNAFYTIIHGGQSVKMVFYAFGTVGVLLSNLYWITYVVLRPDGRMPFAANEIGEWAMFLLFGACLLVDRKEKATDNRRVILAAVCIATANTALWIGWSGEWIQDILTGIVFGYFLYAVMVSWKEYLPMPPKGAALTIAVLSAVFILQAMTFFSSQRTAAFLDLLSHILLFAVVVFLLFLFGYSIRRKKSPKLCFCISSAYLAWIVMTLYMSDGIFYNITILFLVLNYPMSLYCLKKEEPTL